MSGHGATDGARELRVRLCNPLDERPHFVGDHLVYDELLQSQE
jgi:hypothetical protein